MYADILLSRSGTGFWRGAQGRLYPEDRIRAPLLTHGRLSLAVKIVPAQSGGVPDSLGRGYFFLSVGLSNTEQEFEN